MLLWGQQLSSWIWYRYPLLRKTVETLNVTLYALISLVYLSCLIIPVDPYIWKRRLYLMGSQKQTGNEVHKAVLYRTTDAKLFILWPSSHLPFETPYGPTRMVERNQPGPGKEECSSYFLIAEAYRPKKPTFYLMYLLNHWLRITYSFLKRKKVISVFSLHTVTQDILLRSSCWFFSLMIGNKLRVRNKDFSGSIQGHSPHMWPL